MTTDLAGPHVQSISTMTLKSFSVAASKDRVLHQQGRPTFVEVSAKLGVQMSAATAFTGDRISLTFLLTILNEVAASQTAGLLFPQH